MNKYYDCLNEGGVNENYIKELRNTMIFKAFPDGQIRISPYTIPWKGLISMTEWDYDLMMNPKQVGDLGIFGGAFWIPVYFINDCELFKDIKDECYLKQGEEISYNIPEEVQVFVHSELKKAKPSEKNIDKIGKYYIDLVYDPEKKYYNNIKR